MLFRKLRRLPFSDCRLLLEMAALVSATRLGLWLLPFQRVRRVLSWLARVLAPSRRREPPSPQRIVWAVTRASRYVPGATCLTQALAVQTLFERRGQPARLRIGIAGIGRGQIEGHAWVESRGKVVVGGGALSRYAPLPALDHDRP